MTTHFPQDTRVESVLEHPGARPFRKRARILAVQINYPFTVETDRGLMTGEPGDWLVTNHPDDDPHSDLWSISDARMKATYEEVAP